MSYFYFFEHDGQCVWMKSEIFKNWPYYVSKPLAYEELGLRFQKTIKPYEGKKKYYVISDWITHVKTEKIPEAQATFAKDLGYNIVKSLKDLPEGAGVYITGYDSYADEVEEAMKRGIAVINNECPWINRLKKQILSINPETHQCIFMMDQQHVLYRLYQKICPADTIYILPETYKELIKKYKNEKPAHLLCYTTFRVSEIERVVDLIHSEYPHPDNDLYGYKTTMCAWTKQGIYEELHACIKEKNINEFWLIYTSETDRSLRSLVSEIKELNIRYKTIRMPEDVPRSVAEGDRVGVIITPVPIAPSIIKSILALIRQRFIEPSNP